MMNRSLPPVSTYSIVAFDSHSGDLGIAVESKFLAVGAIVPWAKAGIGAIATQSYANTAYGPDGLALLAQGCDAQETIERLINADEDKALRQIGIVSASGDAATFTGSECHAWAGGVTRKHYCCQNNILVSQAKEIQEHLMRLGLYSGEITGRYDEVTKHALRDFCGIENLEERWQEDALIDPAVLDFLRQKH